jgi:hypothetical protein
MANDLCGESLVIARERVNTSSRTRLNATAIGHGEYPQLHMAVHTAQHPAAPETRKRADYSGGNE